MCLSKTKREINKKIKILKNPTITKEIKEINQSQLFKESKPYLKKKLNLNFGEIVELDACQHRWINNEKFYVYHAVESKTGMILAIHVEKEETTLGYYLLLEKMLKKYGAPTIIKTDKRKTFWGTESTQTLMQQSLNALNIELICDSSPTFKPNVERSFYTSQIFYPKLAFLKNINTLEDFQKNIDEFAISYNLKFNKKSEGLNLFRQLNSTLIENHICPKHKAKIANGMFVTFSHRALAPINEKGKRMLLKIGGYLNIHLNLHTNELFTIFENRKLLLVDVDPNLMFEDKYENFMIAKRKFEIEKQKHANKSRFINQNLERKKANISYQIKHLEKLITEAKNNGILIKTDY